MNLALTNPYGARQASSLIVFAYFSCCRHLSSRRPLPGTVINGTTGKPAARDAVVLIRLGQGMEEVASTRTDVTGHFSLRKPDAGPYIMRAIHQGVTYHRMAPPGTSSVELQVFDVSPKVEGVRVIADVMRFQAQGRDLQGIRLFVVNNASNPPRTQMHGNDFQFFLPNGAQIDQGMAMTAGPANQFFASSRKGQELLRIRVSPSTRRNSVSGCFSHGV